MISSCKSAKTLPPKFMKRLNLIEPMLRELLGSHAFDRENVLQGFKIIEALIEGRNVRSVEKFTDKVVRGGKACHLEGFKGTARKGIHNHNSQNLFYFFITHIDPDYKGEKFETMRSIEGERKVNTPLPTKYFTSEYVTTQMMGGIPHYLDGSSVYLQKQDRIEASALLIELDRIIESTPPYPMACVLEDNYDVRELLSIQATPPSEFEKMIEDLENLITIGKEFHSPNFRLPLLAKGLNGNFRSIRNRARMRTEFWKEWNSKRCDMLALAECFQPSGLNIQIVSS
ncbi:TPA: hypothetical protein KD885_003858 [Vibrio parahaemolyticus]|nr:hypothetical protein [Vibrio parahaemolyticus]